MGKDLFEDSEVRELIDIIRNDIEYEIILTPDVYQPDPVLYNVDYSYRDGYLWWPNGECTKAIAYESNSWSGTIPLSEISREVSSIEGNTSCVIFNGGGQYPRHAVCRTINIYSYYNYWHFVVIVGEVHFATYMQTTAHGSPSVYTLYTEEYETTITEKQPCRACLNDY